MRDDWRLQGQERFLKRATLYWRSYTPYRPEWDHDHCEFCSRKLSANAGDINDGYSTHDGYHWICRECFTDFIDLFEWTVVPCTD